MTEEQRKKLQDYEWERVSIGITEDGRSVSAIYVPWEHTVHAYNMRTPHIFLAPEDLRDPEILTLLDSHTVIGCYVFTPLEDYSLLARFTGVEDIHILRGEGITDLSFAQNMTGWYMFYLEGGNLKNLDPLFCQERKDDFPRSFCLGFHNCRVEDVSAAERSGRRLSELIVGGPDDNEERKKWRSVPARTFRYYVARED